MKKLFLLAAFGVTLFLIWSFVTSEAKMNTGVAVAPPTPMPERNGLGEFTISCYPGTQTDTIIAYSLRSNHVIINYDAGQAWLNVTPLDSLSKSGFANTTKRYKLDNVIPRMNAGGDSIKLIVCLEAALPSVRTTAEFREIEAITVMYYDHSIDAYFIRYKKDGLMLEDTIHPANLLRIWKDGVTAQPKIGVADFMDDDPA